MKQLPDDASADQSNVPNGYYRRSNGMVMQLPEIANQSPALPVVDMDYMDDEACRKLCREELVIAIKANSGKPVIANLVNVLLDRIDGKPAQSQAVTIDANVSTTQIIGVSHEHAIDIARRYIERQSRYLTIENQ